MIEIKLYKSPWKAIWLILMGLPFVAACAYFILKNDGDRTMDWFGLCFFGLLIPFGLFNLFDRRPQIIMNEAGIFNRMGYKDFLKWSWIKDAYIKDINTFSKQTFVYLVIDPNAEPLLKGNKTLRKFVKDLGFPEVSISLNPLQKIDEQKYIEFIKAMSTADAPTKQNLLLSTTF